MNYKPYKHLPPFKGMVLQNFPFIEEDFDAITNYQLLCKVVKYLKNVIDNELTMEENVTNLYNSFVELKNYVDNYFKNLDVQEEINNKLDEMTESGELAEIISLYINSPLKISFPYYKMEGEDTLGDCSILKSTNKSMMIDCFINQDNCYIGIQEALYHLGVSKLDYLLITHYHADHYGCIYRLINDGYLDNATVILPRTSERYPSYNGLAIISALKEKNINYELCDNQTIYLDEVKVSLFNGNATDYAYYDAYEGTPDISYNDYSIYANVEYKDKRILFTGDGDYVSTSYITPRYLLSGYDLLKDNHHGFIKFNPDYVKKVNPKMVLIPASIGMVNLNLSRWAIESGYWQLDTSHIYVQGYQKQETVFEVKMNSLQCVSDSYSVQGFSSSNTWNYYVDGTTENLIRTGSKENPFKTLGEAVMLVPKNTDFQIKINVIDLSSDSYPIYFKGFNSLYIDFNNVVLNQQIKFSRCNNIQLLNVNTTKNIYISDSNIYVSNLTSHIEGEKCLEAVSSNIEIYGEIDASGYSVCVFEIGRNSHATLAISSFINEITSGHLINAWCSFISFTNACIAVLKNYKFLDEIINSGSAKQCNFSINYEELTEIFNSTTPVYTTVICSENLNNYDYVEIDFQTSDGYTGTGIFKTSDSHCFNLLFTNANGDETYIKNVRFVFSNKNIILSRNSETAIRSNDNTTIASGNYIGITKVRGIIK